MTHAVVWIDHTEARIFHVHPDAADELGILSPQHHVHRHPKGRGEPRSTRRMRCTSLTRSREDLMGSTRSSLSGRLQRSTSSSSSRRRSTGLLYPRSSVSRQPIIRPVERSSRTQDTTSRRAIEWAVLVWTVNGAELTKTARCKSSRLAICDARNGGEHAIRHGSRRTFC